MNQRFQDAEIRLVAEQYAENDLYRAVCSIGSQIEAELKFGLCPEECFTDIIELLSTIAEKGEDILPDIENIWLRKYNEFRRLERQISEEEIRKTVAVVFAFTILATDSSRHRFYRYTLPRRLMETIVAHQFDGWQTTLDRIFDVPLPNGWFDAFLNEEPEADADKLSLPKAINTKRAQKYFTMAVKRGYMNCENGKFSWIGTGKRVNKSELAYFLGRIYGYRHSVSGNTGTEFPTDELNALFGETKLYDLLVQVHTAQKEQKWRALIDELFE